MATASSSSSSLTVSLFFNGAQETVALPQSGRYALPDGAIESTAVAFCVDPRDAQTSPLPFGIIRQNGPSGTHVEVTKDAVIFVGDLVSVDGDSVTLSVGSGVTQTIVGYDDLSVQRHDRPTIAIAQDLPRVCDHARVAFVRQGLSWHPSYAVYLGGNGDGDGDGADVAWIERIDIVANITNGTDQKVDAADAWAVAAHVPLPGGTAGIPRPIPQRLATTMTRSAAPMSRPPEAYAPVRDESSMMAATSAYAASGNDDDDDNVEDHPRAHGRPGRYPLGALRLARGASVSLPLLRTGPPADQASLYFYTLPDGPDDHGGPVLDGYRFAAEWALPAGPAAVFDANMGFVGVTDVEKDAVPGEYVDLVLARSTSVGVDSTTETETTYDPVVRDRRRTTLDGAPTGPTANDVGATAIIAPDSRHHDHVLARATDHVLVRGTVRNSTDDTVDVILFYRMPSGAVLERAEPQPDRTVQGRLEWRAPFGPGRSGFTIALRLYRGERVVPDSF